MFIRSDSNITEAMRTAAIVVLCGSAMVNAQAQDSTDERLLACDGISDPIEKMACFDAVVKGLKQADDVPTVAAPDATLPAATVPAAAVGATVAVTPAPAPEPEPAAEQPSATPTPADPLAEPMVTATSAAEDFGFETKKDESAEEKEAEKKTELKSLQATIVRSWTVADERFMVELENGQVWQENGGLYIGLPKEGSPVEIVKGRFGGYRMKIGTINKLTPVRRTK